ncbi:uncharacterized protein LOC117644630 [Thrips palmi]|uniref:Uncharacterized protein LOC117644630 n=1 Tax=Thrips palmi TaxID=161013 RepID=A0A6P8Z0P0_THRPL|nr:uncharacterized protein LOC117644630 [Thrips palmi]
MSLIFLLVGVLLLNGVDQVRSKAIHTFAGPFIAFAHTIDPCPSDGIAEVFIRPSHFNPIRPFEKQTLQGYMRSSYNVSDDLLAHVDMAIRSNNQWKDNAFVFNFPNSGCTALREHLPDMYRIVAKYTGAPLDKKKPCIIPGGYFDFKNETISWTFPHFPVMPYGRYKFRISARHMSVVKTTTVPHFCVYADCEIIPKPTVDP